MKVAFFFVLTLLLTLTGLSNSDLPVTCSQTTKDSFIVSLITSDSVLVPFAQYRRGRWENPWPKSAHSLPDEPNTLADRRQPWFAEGRVPSPVWYFWSTAGKGHFLTASKIVEVESHCQKLWGIVSDLPKEEAGESRYGIVGVALDTNRQVSPAYEIKKTQDDWSRLQSFVEAKFTKEEKEKATELSRTKPPRREAPETKTITLSHLYALTVESSGERLYYFESVKDCLSFTGWISAKAGALKLIDSKIGWTDCEDSVDSIPLGLLAFDGEVFIFVRELGYEGDEYVIFKFSESRMQMVLETYGGSC